MGWVEKGQAGGFLLLVEPIASQGPTDHSSMGRRARTVDQKLIQTETLKDWLRGRKR